MYHLDRRRAEGIKDKSKSVNDTGKKCFSKKASDGGKNKKKKSLLVYAFPILATIIVSGMNSYCASFSVTFIVFLTRMRNENFNASYIL